MTRKEALEFIGQSVKSDVDMAKIVDAIQNLYAEPCEDCISRQAVIDKLNWLGRNAFKDDTDYDNLFAFVDNLPPVTPKQKMGHWIPDRCDMYDCSECGRTYTSFKIGTCDATFCPNCGAKMRESGVENDGNDA